MKAYYLCLFYCVYSLNAIAVDTRWEKDILIQAGGRTNILDLSENQFATYVHHGKIHTQHYPITVTGALVPTKAMENFLDSSLDNPLRYILKKAGAKFTGLNSLDDLIKSIGLHPYPQNLDSGVYAVPYPDDHRPDYRLGFSPQKKMGTDVFTFSCAACHSSNLFGKTVLGLTNRFPKANDYFVRVKKYSPTIKPLVDSWLFKTATGATAHERQIIKDTLNNLERVSAKSPIVAGLDTSLAQVSLSLNKRANDEYATPDQRQQNFPRQDYFLDSHPADSKPAVWWNLKYKNRWLSDGSVIQGNPVITNILWNEIGRGTDLKELDIWLKNNKQVIDELTAAVFSIEAPRYTDFFDVSGFDIISAKRGEHLFNQTCAKCHGTYEKAWTKAESASWPIADQIKTTLVTYKDKTPVIDVGTDPNRYLGMKSLEQLNKLKISKDHEVIIQAQKGYVPPPLVGIWARWPYFHNNSAPTLCAVLTATEQRPTFYYFGEANNKDTDFDQVCNGYPAGSKTPTAWIKDIQKFDTTKEGLHNTGHDIKIFIKDGVEILSSQDKTDIIRFLQTL